MLIAVPKAFRLGASWAARKYAGALMSSVSAETVRMRLMPSRYVGDMCSRPSTSLPLLMRCSVVASVLSSTAIFVFSCCGECGFTRMVAYARLLRVIRWIGFPAVRANAFEVAAAGPAAILAQQQL